MVTHFRTLGAPAPNPLSFMKKNKMKKNVQEKN